jgi:hypothetical protein
MPNRTLKETVRKSHKLNAISDSAQALWFRLLTCVDDYGRFDAEPTLVASACYPLRLHANASRFEKLVKELADIGLIVLYEHKSDKYLYLTNWDKGNIRAKNSKFPEPSCMQMQADACNDTHMSPYITKERNTNSENEETKEDVSYGEFGNLKMTAAKMSTLRERYPDIIDTQIEAADGWIQSKGFQRRYSDWYAFLRNWCEKKAQDSKPKDGPDPEFMEGVLGVR